MNDLGQKVDISAENTEKLEELKAEFLTETKGFYNPKNKGEVLK